MNLRKIIWLPLLLVAFAFPALAQQQPTIEYGQPSELRGVTKIFVDTGVDAEQRNLIAKAIQKRLPNVEVVSRPEESEVHLRFTLTKAKDGESQAVGTIVKLVGNNRERILFNSKGFIFPVSKQSDSIVSFDEYAKPYLFAIEFIKAYRKANSESKT